MFLNEWYVVDSTTTTMTKARNLPPRDLESANVTLCSQVSRLDLKTQSLVKESCEGWGKDFEEVSPGVR